MKISLSMKGFLPRIKAADQLGHCGCPLPLKGHFALSLVLFISLHQVTRCCRFFFFAFGLKFQKLDFFFAIFM